MSELIVDIGNTRAKTAIFRNDRPEKVYVSEIPNINFFEEIFSNHKNIEHAIISTVRSDSDNIIQYIGQKVNTVFELNSNTRIPITLCYETPQTLGKDRIAAAVGAYTLYPKTDLLIIDAGTAITYDFIDKNKQYYGGFISPGIQMRVKALNHFTQKLPLVNIPDPKNIEGNNTTNSIIGGIQYGLQGEIENIISHYRKKSNNLFIILTGGDKNYFEILLKNHKFVAAEITLIGLHTILKHNT